MITHESSTSSFLCRSLRTVEYEDRDNRKGGKLAKAVEYGTKRGMPTGMHLSSCEHLVALVQPDAEKESKERAHKKKKRKKQVEGKNKDCTYLASIPRRNPSSSGILLGP